MSLWRMGRTPALMVLRYDGSMHMSALTRHRMRELLDQVLRTDADFDAFCIDFFPDVQRRFGSGMLRTQKASLLLEVEHNLSSILDKLKQRHPDDPALVGLSRRGDFLFRHWWWLGASLLVTVSLVLYLLLGHKHSQPSAGTLSRPYTSPTLPPSATLRPSSPPQPGGRVTVIHQGDIRAQGHVHVTAPAGASETVIKTLGQIEAGGDVNIGVIDSTAPAARSLKQARE
jgi:hypothetical protein